MFAYAGRANDGSCTEYGNTGGLPSVIRREPSGPQSKRPDGATVCAVGQPGPGSLQRLPPGSLPITLLAGPVRERNFKALFESVGRDQVRRGVLQADDPQTLNELGPPIPLTLIYKNMYICGAMKFSLKPVEFLGTALEDLRSFPVDARQAAGYQLDRVQHGLDPSDWKPMASIGGGVFEIRISEAAGAFRVIYVAKFAQAVYVLHCFQKKSAKTAQSDVHLATKRYKDLLKDLKP